MGDGKGLGRWRVGGLACAVWMALAPGQASGLTLARGAQEPGRGAAEGTDLETLARELRAPFPDARRRAVKGLATLGTDEAWRLVFRALEDRDGQVADAAQLALADVATPRLLRELEGKAGLASADPWVRLRVAEALGRMPGPLSGDTLAAAFDRKDPSMTGALLWSLERLAADGRLVRGDGAVVRRVGDELRHGRDGACRARALLALAALDPERARAEASAARSDRDPAVRVAALRVGVTLGSTGFDRAEWDAWVAHAVGDAAPWVRLAALESAAARPGAGALAALVSRLEAEPRVALRARALELLRATTGYRHGPNPAAWRGVVSSLPAAWDGRPVVAGRAADADGARTLAALGRLDPASDRLAILIDFSGSLWNVRADGRTRKELLDPEFRTLVGALPPEARFNVVPYTAAVFPWQDALVPADPRRVREAQDAFGRWAMRGQGDAFGALEVALADPEVDRILLLTDGAPTGGRRFDLGLMVELLLERRRVRPVIFDVVLIDAPRGTERRWQRLTDSSGGRLLAVKFGAG